MGTKIGSTFPSDAASNHHYACFVCIIRCNDTVCDCPKSGISIFFRFQCTLHSCGRYDTAKRQITIVTPEKVSFQLFFRKQKPISIPCRCDFFKTHCVVSGKLFFYFFSQSAEMEGIMRITEFAFAIQSYKFLQLLNLFCSGVHRLINKFPVFCSSVFTCGISFGTQIHVSRKQCPNSGSSFRHHIVVVQHYIFRHIRYLLLFKIRFYVDF